MEVRFFNFAKIENSTKAPTGNGYAIPCTLKSINDLETLSIELPKTNNLPQYNYCYIPKFKRYYFVENVTFNGGLYSYDLVCDVLASFKAEILSSTQFIERSASLYNGNILDSQYLTLSNMNVIKKTVDFPVDRNQGMYIVGVVGKANASGIAKGTVYYGLTPTQMVSFVNYLNSNFITDFNNYISNLDEQIVKEFIDPFNYVRSCMFMPVPTLLTGETVQMNVGGVNVPNINAKVVREATRTFLNIAIPKHPQSARGVYVNIDPYTKYTITIPNYGSLDLDTNLMINASEISLDITFDATSGDAYIIIGALNNRLAKISTKIGVNIQLSQAKTDALGSIIGVAEGIAGIGASTLLGSISGVANSLVNTGKTLMNTMRPSVSSTGSNSNFAYLYSDVDVALYAQFLLLSNEDLHRFGRPYMAQNTLSASSGYTKCNNANFTSPNATKGEIDKINTLLNGGFYNE